MTLAPRGVARVLPGWTPGPTVLGHFVVARDVGRSRRFYTEDKPTVVLEPLPDPDRVTSFLIVRVADIQAIYEEWGARGAQFLTPLVAFRDGIRCHLRDPDGHLIEVGQSMRA